MGKPEEKQQDALMRIMGTDIKAENSILYGLAKIKGVNIMFSNALCHVLKFDKNAKISSLSEKDIEKIENYLSSPKKEGIPQWLFNKQKDDETGENVHLVSKDIEFDLLQLRRRLGKIKSYKGLRLRANLPVRGQRTKANFRRNKMLAAKKAKTVGGRK